MYRPSSATSSFSTAPSSTGSSHGSAVSGFGSAVGMRLRPLGRDVLAQHATGIPCRTSLSFHAALMAAARSSSPGITARRLISPSRLSSPGTVRQQQLLQPQLAVLLQEGVGVFAGSMHGAVRRRRDQDGAPGQQQAIDRPCVGRLMLIEQALLAVLGPFVRCRRPIGHDHHGALRRHRKAEHVQPAAAVDPAQPERGDRQRLGRVALAQVGGVAAPAGVEQPVAHAVRAQGIRSACSARSPVRAPMMSTNSSWKPETSPAPSRSRLTSAWSWGGRPSIGGGR